MRYYWIVMALYRGEMGIAVCCPVAVFELESGANEFKDQCRAHDAMYQVQPWSWQNQKDWASAHPCGLGAPAIAYVSQKTTIR